MGKLQIPLSSSWLPKGWEEISRDSSDNQVMLKLGHVNPEGKANPLLVSGVPTATVDGETYTVHGIDTRGSVTGFFETMTKFAETGLMEGYTPERIAKMRKQYNTLKNEKYDTEAYVTVVRYEKEEWAQDALDNLMAIRSGGLGAMKIPGLGGNITDLLKIDKIRQQITPEQEKLFKEMMAKSTEELQKKSKEENMNLSKGTLWGHPAAMMEMENPEYLRQEEAKKRPKQVVDKKKFQGGGFDPLAGKGVLPKKPKPSPPPKILKSYLGIRVGRYLVTSDLMMMMDLLPKGSDFRESLTKTDTYVEKEVVEGQEYITKHLIPVTSNYETEGYVCQEHIEKILTGVIDSLDDKN